MKEDNAIAANKRLTKNSCDTKLVEFTDVVGGNGKWQVKLMFLSILSQIFAAFHHLAMSFLAYPVDHWCERPKESNISLNIWWTEFLPNATIKELSHHSQCEEYIFNNETATVSLATKPCVSWEYSSEFNSIVNNFEVVCENEWLLSTSQSVYMLGFLCAAMISGQISDVYGRHKALMINVVIFLLSGVAVAFANSFFMFCVLRFFVALGVVGMDLVMYIIFVECTGSQQRAKYTMLSTIGWHIGYISLPLIAWLLTDWFSLQLAISLPSLLFITFYWVVPESPRWLLSHGKHKEALPILQDAAKMNKMPVDDLEAKIKTMCNSLEEEKKESKVSVLDLLKTPQLRKKTLCLYFIWAITAFTYYGLSLNTNDLPGDVYINFAFSGIMEIPATLFCIFTMDRFGRKKPFMFSLLNGGIFCFACIFVPDNHSLVKTIFSMIGKLFVSAAFCIVYIYSAEIFPTVARNIGVGSCSTMARIGSALAPFMKDLAKTTGLSVTMAIFGAISIIGAGLLMLLPETSNLPMPETLHQAESFGKKKENLPSKSPS